MKILQVNKFFHLVGGAERYMFVIRNILKAHGHEVMDFSIADEKNEPSAYDEYFLPHLDLKVYSSIFDRIKKVFHTIYSPSAARCLEMMIQERGIPDVAHLHNFNYHLTPSIIKVLHKYNIPIVWTIHCFKMVKPLYYKSSDRQNGEQSRMIRFFMWLEFFIHTKITKQCFKIDRYVPSSKFLARLAVDEGFPIQRMRQLYNVIENGILPASQPKGDYYVYVGRLVPEKGIRLLLKAFKQMPERSLKIIGHGLLSDEVQSFIRDNNSTNIEFVGSKFGDELKTIISLSKGLILPSVHIDNNPLVILEAMSLGRPVIASNLGGIPEMVEDGVDGVLFSPSKEDELILAVNRLEKLNFKTLSDNALARFERSVNKEEHCRSLMEIYKEAMQEVRGRDIQK